MGDEPFLQPLLADPDNWLFEPGSGEEYSNLGLALLSDGGRIDGEQALPAAAVDRFNAGALSIGVCASGGEPAFETGLDGLLAPAAGF